MPINRDAIGATAPPVTRSWSSNDAMLYALAVGAGDDPLSAKDLSLVTENSAGISQQALPTFATVLLQSGVPKPDYGAIDRSKLLHASQCIEIREPLPVQGEMVIRSQIVDIADKGSGALVTTEHSAISPDETRTWAVARSAMFIRGEGGWGPRVSTRTGWSRPDRAPDLELRYQTYPNQALLYRLCGDRNPLHSDPAFARRAGFDRPILHGLCVYGITARLLINHVWDGDSTQFGAMEARFSSPVYPGDALHIVAWRGNDGELQFQTRSADGTVHLDHGRVVSADR